MTLVLLYLLAAVFLIAGLRKFVRPDPELRTLFGARGYALIGVVEIGAACGLALPTVTGIGPLLVPLAAVGVVLLMVGAVVTNLRVGHRRDVPVNVVLIALAATVAVLTVPS